MSAKYCCMMLRITIDCNACCKKLKKIIVRMKEIETHLIEKPEDRVSVCGRFQPADIAIKLRKKMKRRVEIMDIQKLDEGYEEEEDKKQMHH